MFYFGSFLEFVPDLLPIFDIVANLFHSLFLFASANIIPNKFYSFIVSTYKYLTT
jgi:hypothetical protein